MSGSHPINLEWPVSGGGRSRGNSRRRVTEVSRGQRETEREAAAERPAKTERAHSRQMTKTDRRPPQSDSI